MSNFLKSAQGAKSVCRVKKKEKNNTFCQFYQLSFLITKHGALKAEISYYSVSIHLK